MNDNSQGGLLDLGAVIGKIPFWSRFVFFSLVLTWLLDLLTGIPASYMASSINNTFHRFLFYTPLSSQLYASSLFTLLTVTFSLNSVLPKLEERCSSIVVILKFMASGIFIGTVTLGVQWLLGIQSQLNGVTGVWFSIVYKYCFYNPQGQFQFCLCKLRISKQLYPFILYLLCCLLTFSVDLAGLVGLLLAVLEVRLPRISMLTSPGVFQRLESCISPNIKCWVPFTESRKFLQYSDETMYRELQQYRSEKLGSGDGMLQKSTAENPFFSKQGIRIGDS